MLPPLVAVGGLVAGADFSSELDSRLEPPLELRTIFLIGEMAVLRPSDVAAIHDSKSESQTV